MNMAWKKLSEKERKKILFGVPGYFEISYVTKHHDGKLHRSKYEGLIPNLERRFTEADSTNDAYFKRIANFATEQMCRECHGYRLKQEYLSVYLYGKNIGELSSLSVTESIEFFSQITLSKEHAHIAQPVLKNIRERLEFLS